MREGKRWIAIFITQDLKKIKNTRFFSNVWTQFFQHLKVYSFLYKNSFEFKVKTLVFFLINELITYQNIDFNNAVLSVLFWGT